MTDALARAYLPGEEKNSIRFTSLVRDFGAWPEHERVSLPQLSYRSAEAGTISAQLGSEINARLMKWQQGTIIRLASDALEQDMLSFAQNTTERALVSRATHLNLLYQYRSTLVHEFREPGYGIEVTGEQDDQPYYIGMSDLKGQDTWELVYPVAFFKRIALAAIDGLEKRFIRDDANPYAAYDFGSVWVHRAGAKPKTTP